MSGTCVSTFGHAIASLTSKSDHAEAIGSSGAIDGSVWLVCRRNSARVSRQWKGEGVCSRNRGSLPLVENLSATVRSLSSRSAHKE